MKIEEAIRYFEAKENETVEALAWLKSKAMNDHIEWEHELAATRMAIQALREKLELKKPAEGGEKDYVRICSR